MKRLLVSLTLRKANKARDERDWPTAALRYREAISSRPQNASLWVQYGHALKELGKVEQAEEAYRKAIHLNPVDPDTYLHLGHVLGEQSKSDQASDVLDAGIDRTVEEPSHRHLTPLLLIAKGDLARRARNWLQAVDLYRRGLDLAPQNAPIWVQYGHALKELGRLSESETAYRRAIALEPLGDTHLHLGHNLRMQGRRSDATDAYLSALSLEPSLSASRRAIEEIVAEGRVAPFTLASDLPQASAPEVGEAASAGCTTVPRRAALKQIKPTLHIYTVTFFDFEGRQVYPGGAERYIFDLIEIAREYGLDVIIYQGGHSYWSRRVYDIQVNALPWEGSILKLSARFANEVPPGTLNIYSPFTLTASNLHRPGIGICHGVYWDHLGASLLQTNVATEVLSGVLHADAVVSVDANSINVIRAVRPDLANRLQYVPNYVGGEFFSEPKAFEPERARILYPRRLYKPRGYWLLAEVIPDLLKDYPELVFGFVGDADAEERKHVRELVKRYPANVLHRIVLPQHMPEQYREFDISVIPTVASEGTSLSALEALATGNLVIASDVGGLSNIVVDGLNGYLIPPTSKALGDTLRAALSNPEKVEALRRQGKKTAEAFGKDKWRESWRKIFLSFLEAPRETLAKSLPEIGEVSILHPRVDGITFGLGEENEQGLPKQRPHHLLNALSKIGFDVVAVSDEPQMAPKKLSERATEVLGRGASAYLKRPIIYIYYAYYVRLLGKVADEWLDKLSNEARTPFFSADLNQSWETKTIWFDLIDDPSLHDNKEYSEAVELFVKHADIVSTSSRLLKEQYISKRPDMLLIENACNPTEIFVHRRTVARRTYEQPRRRTIGYIGAIAPWFDFDLVERLARCFPADDIVIAGPISASVERDARKLATLPNVAFTGQFPYSNVGSLLGSFDLAILPFRVNSITNATNPLKLYEYAAAELTVVATNLRELQLIKESCDTPWLRVASTTNDFLQEVNRTLRSDYLLHGESRNFALKNSWLHRAETFASHLRDSGTTLPSRRITLDSAGFMVTARSLRDKKRRISATLDIYGRSCLLDGLSGVIEAEDCAILRCPFFVPSTSTYRMELLLSRDDCAMPGQLQHTVRLAGVVVLDADASEIAGDTEVVVVRRLDAGLHELEVSTIATVDTDLQPCSTGLAVKHCQLDDFGTADETVIVRTTTKSNV